jgi:deazaflavin-dependent oxidoreductase (nitroreductase family)
MPLPRAVAKFNRHATNRVLGTVAPHLPGFGMIVHTGRKSGTTYRTPVNMFRTGNGYVVALTYGTDADWVRNVVAADGCDAVVRGSVVHLAGPRIVHDPERKPVPGHVRPVLAAIGVADFLELSVAQ